MRDAVQEIHVRAEIVHHRAAAGDPATLRRFRKLADFDPTCVRRRDCLAVLAAEMGFLNWPEARRVLRGEPASNFGTLLCPKRCCGHLNLWYKTREEAAGMREQRGGFLLAFRHQFLVVDRYYIESLRLDPEDPDWEAIGFDWTRPGCEAPRARLYSKLLATLPLEK